MAKRVVAGRMMQVPNKKAHRLAAREYLAVWVEDEDGRNEECLLFTESQVRVARERAAKNPEDVTKKGWLANLID
jgi:hypothetical protein